MKYKKTHISEDNIDIHNGGLFGGIRWKVGELEGYRYGGGGDVLYFSFVPVLGGKVIKTHRQSFTINYLIHLFRIMHRSENNEFFVLFIIFLMSSLIRSIVSFIRVRS